MHPVRRGSLVTVLTIAALAASCGSEASPEPAGPTSSSVSQADADAMIGGLCEMSGEMRDDPAAGRTVFYDRVHERLHRIAADAQPIDAALAGTLLEAKQLVEADLEADLEAAAPPPGYGEHVDRLLSVTQEAVVLLGLTDPGCNG